MQSDSSSSIGGLASSRITSIGGLMASGGIGGSSSTRGAIRPTDLPTENRRWIRHRKSLHLASPHLPPTVAHCKSKIVAQSFPTPMEEPKKVLKAQYIGSAEVTQATGMDVLNGAIDHLTETVPAGRYENVNVSVAPSMISINQVSGYDHPTSHPTSQPSPVPTLKS